MHLHSHASLFTVPTEVTNSNTALSKPNIALRCRVDTSLHIHPIQLPPTTRPPPNWHLLFVDNLLPAKVLRPSGPKYWKIFEWTPYAENVKLIESWSKHFGTITNIVSSLKADFSWFFP